MNTQKSILFFSSILPTYDQDSGSNRLKEIIDAFIKLQYTCYFVVDTDTNQEPYSSFFKEKGVLILAKNETDFINQIKKNENLNYIWFNGPNSFKKNLIFCKEHFPTSTTIYDMVDVHFLRYKRAIALHPFKISNYKRYFKYKKIETQLAQKTDFVVAISETEKSIISQYLNSDKILVISNIHYPKIDKKDLKPFSERNNILFIGSAHTPNVDAVRYLYNEIMPLVWKTNPKIKVNIIGNVNEEMKNISHPNIHFLGYIEDIEPYFLTSKLMVAPLRYGAGVKGKIGQAFEYSLPVITTSIGAEGMNLIHNKNALIANNPQDFANAILELYNNEKLWNKLSESSPTVLSGFSKETLIKELSNL